MTATCTAGSPAVCKDLQIDNFLQISIFRLKKCTQMETFQRLSLTHSPIVFPISKTNFNFETSMKCIHDNNGERSFRKHYFIVSSQSIRVALSSLLDSSINRNWEVRLIKSFEAPFRSSRSRLRAMF